VQLTQHSYQFVRREYDPPTEALVGGFILRALNPSYVQDDYEAVMSSRTRLHEFFGIGDPWPPETMSVEDNKRDLEWHADEFKRRSSFTYTVIDPEMSGCAGCVYLFPPTRIGYDVELFMWLRSDRYLTDREVAFRSELRDWICGVWHFDNIGMPGCEVSWQEWNSFRSSNRAMPSPYGPASS
jgi:hypothetical protein